MKDTAVSNLRRRDNFKYVIVAEGVLIGLITGALISVFRLMLIGADRMRDAAVQYVRGDETNISGMSGNVTDAMSVIGTNTAQYRSALGSLSQTRSGAGWLAPGSLGIAIAAGVVLVLIAVIISILLGWEPDISGSGIPQVEAELRGQKDMCWYKVIIGKMIGCSLAIGGGLALGREGPSIQLGSMVGKGVARAGHRLLTEERLLITCGAGAGLSAAFGAPLAGAIFALEELHRNFSAEVLLSTMAASVASEFVAANVFGLTPVFGLEVEHGLPLRYYWAVLILGIILGLFGIIYNRTIAFMQDVFDHIGRGFAAVLNRVPGISSYNLTDGRMSKTGEIASRTGKLIAAFALAYIMLFAYPEVLGSGSHLVGEISGREFTLGSLVILLIIKFVFSTASFGSGSPGGIFLPLLVLGAVTGGAVSELLGYTGFDSQYITAMVVIGMAGYFAAIVRAPVTGVILITEMTGDFTCLLPLVLASLIAYLIPEYFGVEPIYTQLLHRSRRQARSRSVQETTVYRRHLRRDGSDIDSSNNNSIDKSKNTQNRSRSIGIRDRKTVIDAEVHVGSYMDGKSVMEFRLPLGTLIVSVLRDGVEIIPDGHTILRGGDELEILLRERDINDVESIIDERCRHVNHVE